MTAEQMALWAAEMERLGEELQATAHALIVQSRAIQREARPAPLPDGPEMTD